MIKLRRSRATTAISAGFKGAGLKKKILKLIDLYYEALAAGRSIDFATAGWKPAKSQLKRESSGKCAYCEASTDTVAHGDVEHFRPKSLYWWLAYCYDNYLFSCQICNQSFKGDRFPVPGLRLVEPTMPAVKPTGTALDDLVEDLALEAEKLNDAHFAGLWGGEASDLVNPYLEDPVGLFDYDVDTTKEEVSIRATAGARAASAFAAAHACLGINRPELCRDRYLQYASLTMARKAIGSTDPDMREDGKALILTLQRNKQPYAGMARWYARHWGLPLV
ncbi:MAG: hypothetical protein ACREEY_17455 [Brevundimonas sp.]